MPALRTCPVLDAVNIDDSVRLELAIVGYEFPELPDDNWCLAHVIVRQGEEFFEKTDPALEVPDLLRIRDWFRDLADGRLPQWAHLEFVEPCLSFEFLARDGHGIRLAVHLCAELRPKFKLRQLSSVTGEWAVVLHFDADRLSAVALAVEAALAALPNSW